MGLALRWAVPAVLLVAEVLALSLLVDLPTSGEATRLASVLRLALPVAIGAGAAGWLIGRHSPRELPARPARAPPAWRPVPWVAANLAGFAGSAWLALRVLGPGTPPPTTSLLLLWALSFAACALLALGSAAPLLWQVRTLLARWRTPLLALAGGVVAWRAADTAEGLWGALSVSTLRSSEALARLFSGDVAVNVADQALRVGTFEVVVAPVCSGVNGIGLVAVFQALWIALARARLRLPRALVLLPLGAIAAFGANVIRVTALVLVGASGREEIALGGFHSKLGWLLFIGIALGSVALAERWSWLRKDQGGEESSGSGVPAAAAAYVAPLLAAMATALITGVWASGPLDRGYALRILAAAAALALLRGALPRPALAWSWPPLVLGAAVGLAWVAAGGGEPAPLASALAALGPGERWAWVAVRALGSCLAIPLVEELAFRGFLLPWLQAAEFEMAPATSWSWPASILSSLAFGAIHGQWALGALAGLAFAAARRWRGRLADAVLAHAVANLVVAAAVLGRGRWDLWS